MILYSDYDLIKGSLYNMGGKVVKFLGMMHSNGGAVAQYRFKGEGVNSYATLTAQELNNAKPVTL